MVTFYTLAGLGYSPYTSNNRITASTRIFELDCYGFVFVVRIIADYVSLLAHIVKNGLVQICLRNYNHFFLEPLTVSYSR